MLNIICKFERLVNVYTKYISLAATKETLLSYISRLLLQNLWKSHFETPRAKQTTIFI